MVSLKWDAYECLAITKTNFGQLICIGTTSRRGTCTQTLSSNSYVRVCLLLGELEIKAHTNELSSIPDLEHLARLCFCLFHQLEAPKKVTE